MTHFIEKCSCGRVLTQCRCPSSDKAVRISSKPCMHGGAPTLDVLATLRGGLDSMRWCADNLHNYGTAAWLDFFKAGMEDVQRASEALRTLEARA